jgi:prepilin-type N-terminal cleavage/methylation domain-containing protein
MKRVYNPTRQLGFSLIELLVALGIFLLITGAAFALLSSSQQRYQTDSQMLTSFQEARLGVDQIVRDIDDSGFPPPSYLIPTLATQTTSAPFAWSPGYPTTPCLMGSIAGTGLGNCTTSTGNDYAPGDFDIIVETVPNRLDPACAPNCLVQWIRYELVGTTLMRGIASKVVGDDPTVDTAAQLAPFVQNVVNNSPTLQIGQAQLSTAYPNLFPAGAPVPIFQYVCDTPITGQYPAPYCWNANADNSPSNIRDVSITLIVASPLPDATTGQPRLVQLSARGHRVNPNQ